MSLQMSLVEKKKLQWAKEREELASLGAPWNQDAQINERTKYDSKPSSMASNEYFKRNLRDTNTRRGSLPPLYKNQYNSLDRYDKGGETSGYGSDNNNQTPDNNNWNQSGYESSSSRDDRPRWGDKGVGVGKFWQHKEEILNKISTTEPPNWVKRGLKDGEIVVNNTSPSVSPEQRYEEQERPCTGSSYSKYRSTYIRGQNIHIDSIELAERERRRQIALAHQEAIRQQLEDKERKRREEREKRIREEHEEELRIEREQELERKRKEEELRALQEKQEKERKRKQAIQEAIELAQKEAQQEKLKRKNNVNITRNDDNDKTVETDVGLSKKIENTDEDIKENIPKNETLNNEINKKLEITGKNVSLSPRNSTIPSTDNHQDPVIENQILNNALPTPRTENLAIVLPASLETLPNIQYALLVPATPQNIPMIPYNFPHTARSTTSTARTENRILTPTQYRNRNVMLCDSCTQTEESIFGSSRSENSAEGRIREKITNLELTYDNRIRKERRSRSESLEERPKWGVNRPPTRYLKQSEKDPLYQRRKLRQKMRETKTFDDKNSSESESQIISPRPHRRKAFSSEKRPTRAQWRKSDHLFSRNVRMYQTELVPLESDSNQIYYRSCCCSCRCRRHRCSDGNIKVDILKLDRNSPRELHYNTEPEDKTDRLPHVETDVLDKLSALQNGLMIKQEQWDTLPSTPSLSKQ